MCLFLLNFRDAGGALGCPGNELLALMIVVIDKANRRLFAHQLEQLSPLRQGEEASVFGGAWVCGQGSIPGDLADDDTVYIADLDQNHTVTAAFRLTPTLGASLLRDRFPNGLTRSGVQGHSEVYEIAHWMSAELETGEGARERYGDLFCAMFNHSQSKGLTHLNLFCDLGLLPLLLDFEWSVIPLGLPVVAGGRDRLAVVVELSQNAPITAPPLGWATQTSAVGGLH